MRSSKEDLEAALGARVVGARRRGAPGLSARDPRADVDDESGADDLRDAAGARADGGRARRRNGGARLVPRYQRRTDAGR